MLFLFSIKLNAVVIFNMCPVPFDEHFSFMIYDDNNWETILFMDEKKKKNSNGLTQFHKDIMTCLFSRLNFSKLWGFFFLFKITWITS